MPAPADAEVLLERLGHKYKHLAELRARREELEATGQDRFDARESRMRRAAFRRIAREFPGALRELDSMPAEVLRGRCEAVVEVRQALREGARAELPLWMELAAAYHGELREALAVKRWLSRRVPRGEMLDLDVALAFRRWYQRVPFRVHAVRELGLPVLARYLWPPHGRLQVLVWESLEHRFGRPRAELERLIFGSAPLEPAK